MIKSVQNNQQITKAMKIVSYDKLRKAQDSIIQMRPYARKLQEVLSNIVTSAEGELGSNLAIERPVEKVLLIVITFVLGITIVGLVIAWIPWVILAVWYLYRVIRGWLRLNDRLPAPL